MVDLRVCRHHESIWHAYSCIDVAVMEKLGRCAEEVHFNQTVSFECTMVVDCGEAVIIRMVFHSTEDELLGENIHSRLDCYRHFLYD